MAVVVVGSSGLGHIGDGVVANRLVHVGGQVRVRDVDAGVNDAHLDRVGAGGDVPRAGGADLGHGSSDRGPAGVVGGGGGGLHLVVGLCSVACVWWWGAAGGVRACKGTKASTSVRGFVRSAAGRV